MKTLSIVFQAWSKDERSFEVVLLVGRLLLVGTFGVQSRLTVTSTPKFQKEFCLARNQSLDFKSPARTFISTQNICA